MEWNAHQCLKNKPDSFHPPLFYIQPNHKCPTCQKGALYFEIKSTIFRHNRALSLLLCFYCSNLIWGRKQLVIPVYIIWTCFKKRKGNRKQYDLPSEFHYHQFFQLPLIRLLYRRPWKKTETILFSTKYIIHLD